MKKTALLLALLLPTPALALTTQQAGTWVDASAGLAVHTAPAVHLGWQVSAGGWVGPYDPGYRIGRFHGLGLTFRHELAGPAPRYGLTGEYRRGMDLLLFTVYGYANAGAELADGQAGFQGRVGVGGRFRRHPYFALSARLEAGLGTAGGVHGALGFTLGVSWARPWGATEP